MTSCGLNVNACKSFTIAIVNIPGKKKSVVDSNTKFKCEGREKPVMGRDEFKYLRILLTLERTKSVSLDIEFKTSLEKLPRAPLKPKQRLFAIRVMMLPNIYHLFTLYGTALGRLKKIDNMSAVRKWTVCCIMHQMRTFIPVRKREASQF